MMKMKDVSGGKCVDLPAMLVGTASYPETSPEPLAARTASGHSMPKNKTLYVGRADCFEFSSFGELE
jgi:hypothetical protein